MIIYAIFAYILRLPVKKSRKTTIAYKLYNKKNMLVRIVNRPIVSELASKNSTLISNNSIIKSIIMIGYILLYDILLLF